MANYSVFYSVFYILYLCVINFIINLLSYKMISAAYILYE